MSVTAIPKIKPQAKVPAHLIYEIIDGMPIYYRGYKDVLRKLKTKEEIIGASSLQSIILSYIIGLLKRNLDDEKYDTLMGEAGLHLKNKDNLATDLAIYELLSPDKIGRKYMSHPPKIAIEIDIEAESDDMDEHGYVAKKTRKLLDWGVEKVIWIMTQAKTTTVATPNANWQTMSWDKDILLIEDFHFNIAAFITKRGIDPDNLNE